MDLFDAVQELLSAAVVGPDDYLVISLRSNVSAEEFDRCLDLLQKHPLGQGDPPRVVLLQADQVFTVRPAECPRCRHPQHYGGDCGRVVNPDPVTPTVCICPGPPRA